LQRKADDADGHHREADWHLKENQREESEYSHCTDDRGLQKKSPEA
jgi:hypothetical protein